MNVAARLGLFAAGLAVVFVAAFGVGRALGPDDDTQVPSNGTRVTTVMSGDHEMGMGS